MTVKDLIKELEKQNPDAVVTFSGQSDYGDEVVALARVEWPAIFDDKVGGYVGLTKPVSTVEIVTSDLSTYALEAD